MIVDNDTIIMMITDTDSDTSTCIDKLTLTVMLNLRVC